MQCQQHCRLGTSYRFAGLGPCMHADMHASAHQPCGVLKSAGKHCRHTSVCTVDEGHGLPSRQHASVRASMAWVAAINRQLPCAPELTYACLMQHRCLPQSRTSAWHATATLADESVRRVQAMPIGANQDWRRPITK